MSVESHGSFNVQSLDHCKIPTRIHSETKLTSIKELKETFETSKDEHLQVAVSRAIDRNVDSITVGGLSVSNFDKGGNRTRRRI